MSIKRVADDLFTDWHDRKVARCVDDLERNGYEVYMIENVKRPLFGFDVMFSGNITDIHYRPSKEV